ncbi:hypothetical protein ACWDV4_04770 [Micromonospora sp. NPDC003197]
MTARHLPLVVVATTTDRPETPARIVGASAGTGRRQGGTPLVAPPRAPRPGDRGPPAR